MPRKIETWSTDIFEKLFSTPDTAFISLNERELAIVAAGIIDTALAEFLSKRLMDYPNEIDSFLGLFGDGRAPAGTFGARIQLALLTGIISPGDVENFRALKAIRNEFAHRMDVHLTDQTVTPKVAILYEWIENLASRLDAKPSLDYFKEIPPKIKDFKRNTVSSKKVIALTVNLYQMVFSKRVKTLARIPGLS